MANFVPQTFARGTQALILLEYLIMCGNDRVLTYVRKNIYQIQTLREFQYRDEGGADQGNNGTRH
jgi:epsin